MLKIKTNENFASLSGSYLFTETQRRIRLFEAENPEKKVIKLGIGDVTRPLAPTVVEAMLRAAEEMGRADGFHGYAPEAGYGFLRTAIAENYASRGVDVRPEEVYVSDGSKSDASGIFDLFGDLPVVIPDPVYPVYADSCVMSGKKVVYLPATRENGFLPTPDLAPDRASAIFICSPNNPTGAAYGTAGLAEWVAYAKRTGSLIVCDAAYSAFISSDCPNSIYRIPGAKSCAVELNSLSKSAGFTGTRCAWAVFPRELGELAGMWLRRQSAKFNGVAYVVQRAAEAALSKQGMRESEENIAYYRRNAQKICSVLSEKGIYHTGGIDSPYIWLKCPGTDDSWGFFDRMLHRLRIAGTPGAGFGKNGEGYFRLTAFCSDEDADEAAERMRKLL